MLNIEKIYEKLPWLREHQERLRASLGSDNWPHSLLIYGPGGTGKRQLTLWLAEQLLGGPVVRQGADGLEVAHPDLCAIAAPYLDAKGKERHTIGVDRIRDELLPFLELTSHGSGARVVVIHPADAMTTNAANSLLKTLEEPPPGSMLVLICESMARLPATVVSRCQRLRLAPPDTGIALDWLAGQEPGHDFTRLLEFAGGAPLAALALKQNGFADFANEFLGELQQLEQRTVNPVTVAAHCRNQEAVALRLLEWRIAERLRAAAGKAPDPSLQQAGFRQLGQIRELRRVINGGINAELSLAGLLLDWYGGLGHREN